MKGFGKLCTPAKIYFIIAVIGTVIALFSGASIMYAFWKLSIAFIWTFILGWLCNKGYGSISWLLVLLHIIILLGMFDIYNITYEQQRQFMRPIQLQGAYRQEAMERNPMREGAETMAGPPAPRAADPSLGPGEGTLNCKVNVFQRTVNCTIN
jgi:hypothetical protein